MASSGAAYWRVFNVLVRALGLVALGSGALFTVLGIIRILQQGLLTSEGSPPLIILLVGLILCWLGASILQAPAYRPDLGDASWKFEPFRGKAKRPASQRRSWWTGDRASS
jgi:hypothetical protein